MNINVDIMSEFDLSQYLKSLKIGDKFTVINSNERAKVMESARKSKIHLKTIQKIFKHEFEKI